MAEASVQQRKHPAMPGVLVAVAVAIAGLLWAKWWPYQAKAHGLATTHTWAGSGIFGVGGVQPGDAPSWSAATSFTSAYLRAIWKALVAALLISAALQTLVPRTWLLRVLNRRRPVSAAVAGGLAATPSMMCTCCAAPVAVTLRRNGVPTAAVVAYWLGNPLLNPAVLVFLVFVAPWQWTLTRLVVGAAVVVGGAVLVARLTDRRVPEEVAVPGPAADEAPSLRRYLGALLRLVLTLVPEYLVVVMLIGAFRGWLFPLGGDLRSGLLVVVVAAIVGTLMVIPTAGEIPIVQGLVLAGLSLGAAGALLVTLPAVSLPGIAMVGRTFGWRVTTATAAVVVAGGLVGAALLPALNL
ncbi:permease [Actinoplanes sp. NPDC051411]|uniref:permease n=1 Tax=Actinoplanes sp. NPDC051411 TaxID=3155522 RepID=UPI003424D81D